MATLALTQGQKVQFSALFSGFAADGVTRVNVPPQAPLAWASSDPSVMVVDPVTGIGTPVKSGTCAVSSSLAASANNTAFIGSNAVQVNTFQIHVDLCVISVAPAP